MRECGTCHRVRRLVTADPPACQTCIARNRYHTDPTYRKGRIAVSTAWKFKHKEYGNAYSRSRRRTDTAGALLTSARRRAKRLGLPFALTKADIVIPERCPLLGIPLAVGDGKQHANSPSLDRIVPALGYVPANVIVISNRANGLKNAVTPELAVAVLRLAVTRGLVSSDVLQFDAVSACQM